MIKLDVMTIRRLIRTLLVLLEQGLYFGHMKRVIEIRFKDRCGKLESSVWYNV